MKIKYWLIISFLLVMLLPVIALYFLYVSISSYDEKHDLLEYMNVSNRLIEMQPILEDGLLYKIQPNENYDKIGKFANENVKITLYRPDGIILYSSIEDPSINRLYQRSNVETLYKNLNEIQKKHRSYSLKKAVFQDGKIIGLYEVTIARKEWVNGVNDRSITLLVLMSSFFIILYTLVVFLLNRKLNKPLTILQKEMTAFANGQTVTNPNKKTNDEIGELFSHFHRMRRQIEQNREELAIQQKEKEFIVAALSHDLKTPLTVVQAYTEALQDETRLTEKEQYEYKTILFEKLHYMKQMLDDLTIYTALQSAPEKIDLVEVDGQEFFDMLLSGYEEPCAKKHIHLHIEQNTNGQYGVNVKQMMRIVDNLMGNAIRHTESDHLIWLAAISYRAPLPNWVFSPFINELNEWRQGGTIILIQNQGNAIPGNLQKQVFQPFLQVEGARGLGGSSGLGLSISKMLIEKHEGKINLFSKEGYGTLVACWIKERKA
ncbi:HAMP domain-containing sensor histidine kinase [Metabacillus sp. FJAT-53654]|uniref:histidine kinase n=1 Tax=Metabacillus rhizosphaerae TaxID=3117747 RepID=A0ABZ2MMK6_9BACI